MNRNETRGQLALARLAQMVPPQQIFIGAEAKRLYALEEKRSKAIRDCAQELAKLLNIPEEEYWTRTLPQTLFDIFDNYEVATGVIAAETFLKQLGWKIERPPLEV